MQHQVINSALDVVSSLLQDKLPLWGVLHISR